MIKMTHENLRMIHEFRYVIKHSTLVQVHLIRVSLPYLISVFHLFY